MTGHPYRPDPAPPPPPPPRWRPYLRRTRAGRRYRVLGAGRLVVAAARFALGEPGWGAAYVGLAVGCACVAVRCERDAHDEATTRGAA